MIKQTHPYDKESGELFFRGVSARMNHRGGNALMQREYEKIVGPTTKTIHKTITKKRNQSVN